MVMSRREFLGAGMYSIAAPVLAQAPAPAPSPAPVPAAQPPVASKEQTVLRLHHALDPDSPLITEWLKPWTETVARNSNGSVRIDITGRMQLGGRPSELYDQARIGVVDLVWTLLRHGGDRFPKAEVFELPMIASSAATTSAAAWDFAQEHLADELGEVKLLATHTHGPSLVHMRTTALKSARLRCPTRSIQRFVKRLGGRPVSMPPHEVGAGLSAGMIDGAIVPWHLLGALKMDATGLTHLDPGGKRGLSTALFVVAMNRQRFDALAEPARTAIDQLSGAALSRSGGEVMDRLDAQTRTRLGSQGQSITMLSAPEAREWERQADAVVQDWITGSERRKVDGRLMVNALREKIDKQG